MEAEMEVDGSLMDVDGSWWKLMEVNCLLVKVDES